MKLLKSIIVYSICFVLEFTNGRHVNEKRLSPVVIVPGDGGSHLLAQWDKPHSMKNCKKVQKDWFQIWLNADYLLCCTRCFSDNVRLVYDNVTRTTKNSPGVQIKVNDFGNSTAVEYLANEESEYSQYFAEIVSRLIYMGYDRTYTIRAAPYDFRKAPNELKVYFKSLEALIEEAYTENEERVTLISHSLGSPMMHYFLINKEQSWKDKYIQSLISISGAWGGAVKSAHVFAAGYDFSSGYLDSELLKPAETNPSLAFLLPSRMLWKADDVLVQTPSKNYSIGNFKEFFDDIEFPDGYEMYLDTRDLLYKAPPPGVEVHCMYGVGSKTVEKVIYTSDKDFPLQPTGYSEDGDGDGTVNRRSLELCLKWTNEQKQKVTYFAEKGANHVGILKTITSCNYIANILKKAQKANLERVGERPANLGRMDERPANLGRMDERQANLGRMDERTVNLGGMDERPANLGRMDERPANLGRMDERPANLGRMDERPANLGRMDEPPVVSNLNAKESKIIQEAMKKYVQMILKRARIEID